MLNCSDISTTLTPNPDDVMAMREFLGVATFLKPQFRIAVAPRSGELKVQVELTAADVKRRATH